MSSGPAEASPTVFTIGHSNHPPARLLDLLRGHGIEVVADVRSSPYSRYCPHFDREAIRDSLGRCGIEYVFLGDALGGRPSDDRFYDEEGYVLYGRLAQSAQFLAGIERLLEMAAARRTALLCGEEDPTECHRRLLIGRVLIARGLRVLHIRGDGRVQTEEEVAAAEELRRTGGQISLFDELETTEWKSTRSVSPRKPRRSSSGPSGGPGSSASSM